MGRRNKDREFWSSADKNRNAWWMYYDMLVNIGMNVFKWENVPDTIDVRYLELKLMTKGKVLFFKDDVLDKFLCLPTATGGPFDFYNIPKYRKAYANNGYQFEGNESNSVIIYNNYLRKPDIFNIQEYAKRLYDIQRTIDVNIRAQKTPVMILADENTRLSMINLYEKFDGNQPYVMVDKEMGARPFSTLNTEAPFVAPKLMDLKHEVWNEALTYFGISNVNTVKKERLISDEVARNMGGIEANKNVRLNARKQACELINNMFGLNMDVVYNTELGIVIDSTQAIESADPDKVDGGDDNE